MIHPGTELRFISPEIGYGVVAKEFIPKGTITWALDKLDREFTPAELSELGAPYTDILDTYAYRNSKGNFILCWDHARFVNHSFRSNCLSTSYEFEVAVRDIHPGEQLTDDYGYLNVSEPFHAQPEGTARTVVYPDDIVRLYPEWDAQLEPAFALINAVKQPLIHLLSPETQALVQRVLAGAEPLASIRHNYFDPALNGVSH